MAQTTAKSPAGSVDVYLDKFSRFEREPSQPSWLLPLRKAGIARFAELGIPTLRDEDWRFTNVAPVAKQPFKPAFEPTHGVVAGALEQFTFARLPGSRLVFVNGHYAAKLSVTKDLPEGVKAGSLAAALASDAAFLQKHLGHYAQDADNGFTALNQAFFLDGGFVHVPAGKVVEEPIQFLYLSTDHQR